jgi:hypothetical protein
MYPRVFAESKLKFKPRFRCRECLTSFTPFALETELCFRCLTRKKKAERANARVATL